MKMQIQGEVIEIQELTDGRIYKVLHQNGAGKEIADIYYGKRNKKTGQELTMPDLKLGAIWKGTVRFNGLCFPA